MTIALITGSTGLIGSDSVRHFAERGFDVVGIDNDMRRIFFGDEASTSWNRRVLQKSVKGYRHIDADIRDESAIEKIFSHYKKSISVIVHAAGQPSHDWAVRNPQMDFTVNANGTLILLEMTRKYCPESPFIFLSTNKVYGDTPNSLPLVERETRWELDAAHPYFAYGIDETMSIDSSLHSLFGVSKAAADLMVQEYGRYFGIPTACFRCGCLTGPAHAGAQLHGFLSYLMRCAVSGIEYKVFGYRGKQVRDNVHSRDIATALGCFFESPKVGAVYNMGGGRRSNCSMLEAIQMCEDITGRPMKWSYSDANRSGDHIWWVSDTRRFENDFPEWAPRYDIPTILREIHGAFAGRERRSRRIVAAG